MQWDGSHFIADYVPILKLIQFPWRLSLVTATSVAVLVTYAWDSIGLATAPGRRRIVWLTAAVMILLSAGNFLVIRKFCSFSRDVKLSGNDSAYQIYAGRPLLASEATANLQPLALVRSQPALDPSQWSARRIKSREFLFTAASPQPAHLVLNLICFPGWEAADQHTGRSITLGCDSPTGLVTADVPAGGAALRFWLPLHRADTIGPIVTLLMGVGLFWFYRKSEMWKASRNGRKAEPRP